MSQTVRKRRVFYIPGYDPIHPRRYRELYRSEGTAQAALSGYALALAPKRAGGPYGWHVSATQDGQPVETDVEVLIWAEIVRDSMAASIPATYLQLLRTAWAYIGSGALFRLMRLRKGPVIAALYPIVALILQALAGLGAGAALAGLILWPLPDFRFDWGLGLALCAGVTWAVLRWFRKHDGRFYAYYLMHDYAFTARWGGANPAALETRMAAFGDTIAQALTEDWDEVLVVGHSSGAHLAISVLADLIRAGRVPATGPRLGFLSLGHVVPMVSFLPKAKRLRGDLAYLCARTELTWVDVTAPGDGCAFALCDPVKVSGVGPADQHQPLILSAAFTQTLSPARWKQLRWRFFRLHFQYLCAFDRPGAYDYFRITAGPLTLAERFAQTPPSKSVIETPVNRFTSMA
ncbi:hypothetical protein [Rhodobacter capsulatus]|jgi:hypothetical protein|uniref:hypothetical protein n=1 Tax=Rhodobacter capsulatus TaxID=1061 RepID=UPI0003D37EA7|nr:hypothetical protein [Rhodobacter capsulatus]ETD01398.1 hypothetical protein U714_09290 [Rhodobacter capsulatus DE442]ETD77111.1 hypothetical protein U717_09450 [Rhodobacter capsulatus R121]ETE53815.1 hypothetical protein U715_09455 [Rhodobacter capsulatus Y262]MDS0927066.1 hypothetical protein [Rhodobacter capsulatus]